MGSRIVVASLSLLLGRPAAVLACGGFFCQTTPIDQAAERIVFAVDAEGGTVTTHVQINYQGQAADFAWVVPVPAVPELFITADQLFVSLAGVTQPQFYLDYREEGACQYAGCGPAGDWCMAAEASDTDSADGPPSSGSVSVIAQSHVGPYDTAIVQAGDAGALVGWLQDAGYNLPESLSAALEPYVSDGAFFVALRLSNDKDTGDLAPLGMRYAATKASVPIQLTSIAATPDMRLEVYILGAARAAPENYLHVQINDAAIDWIAFGQNYLDVITRAANEAGGHAFATDFAGSTAGLRGMFYWDGRFDLRAVAAITDIRDVIPVLLLGGFPATPTVQDILREHIPPPAALLDDGFSERDWFNNMDLFAHYITPDYLAAIAFDAVALAADLDARVVQPLRQAEELVQGYPYLTRLTSSISPEEMTLDPLFVFNADLGAVDNIRWATLVVDCRDNPPYYEAPRRLELRDGRVILLPSESWFADAGTTEGEFLADLGAPAAAVIEATSTSGAPTPLADNREGINDRIAAHNRSVRRLFDDGGCNSIAPRLLPLLGLLALVLGRRGRRRR